MFYFSNEVYVLDLPSSKQSIDKKVLRLQVKTTQCDGKWMGNSGDEIQEIMERFARSNVHNLCSPKTQK